MKERRTPLARVTGLAETVAAGVKRRQHARAPRVVLYDRDGRPRTLPAAGEHAIGLIQLAGWMVDLTGPTADPDADAVDVAEPGPLDDPDDRP